MRKNYAKAVGLLRKSAFYNKVSIETEKRAAQEMIHTSPDATFDHLEACDKYNITDRLSPRLLRKFYMGKYDHMTSKRSKNEGGRNKKRSENEEGSF